jgi:hypothetical protein
VADVLVVTALQFSHPVALIIMMKSGDAALHVISARLSKMICPA